MGPTESSWCCFLENHAADTHYFSFTFFTLILAHISFIALHTALTEARGCLWVNSLCTWALLWFPQGLPVWWPGMCSGWTMFLGIYCLTPVSKVGKESPLECGIHPQLSFLLSLLWNTLLYRQVPRRDAGQQTRTAAAADWRCFCSKLEAFCLWQFCQVCDNLFMW